MAADLHESLIVPKPREATNEMFERVERSFPAVYAEVIQLCIVTARCKGYTWLSRVRQDAACCCSDVPDECRLTAIV